MQRRAGDGALPKNKLRGLESWLLSTDSDVFLITRHNFFDEILLVYKLAYFMLTILSLLTGFSKAHLILTDKSK